MLLAALLLSALLTGNEVGTLLAVHPAVRTLGVGDQVRMEQAFTRRYLLIMPVLMTGTVVACFSAGLASHGAERSMLLAAGACYGVMLGITLVGNMVLNVATLRTTPDAATVDTWRAVRRRWDRLHIARVVLDVAGLVLTCAAAVR